MSVETPSSPVRQTLGSVQALRGLAALMVVIFHAAAIWRDHVGSPGRFAGPWDQGYAGVDLFFVISGFIMVWVAGDVAAGGRAAGRFLWHRVTRIYPLWWVWCGVMAGYFLLAYGQPASPDIATPGTAWGFLSGSLALWPQGAFPVLQVGWTLVFEMAFYAVFAALLLLPPRIRPLALGVWAVLLLIALKALPPPPNMPGGWPGVLAHPLCLEFLLGAAVAWIIPRWRDEGWARFLALAGGAALLFWLWRGLDVADPDFAAARVLVYGVPAALLVAALVRAELDGRLAVARSLRALGDMSYSLYLSHFIVLLALKRVLGMVGRLESASALSLVIFALIGTGLSLAIGWASYRRLERPLLRGSRKLLDRGKVTP